MRLGLMLGYSGASIKLDIPLIQEAERIGYDSVWTAEAWGSDAVSPLAWIGAQTSKIRLGTAIMQVPGRTPAMTAMTAITMDQLSGGRFILGLGTSGPQVVEGWHGQPFSKPLSWLKEYIHIVQEIFAREGPLTHDGKRYQIPFRGEGATGQGKPLKSIIHGRPDIPIWTGSMAPKSQAFCAEHCDGVLLTCFNPERPEVILDQLQVGFDASGGKKSLDNFELAPTVAVALAPEPFIDQARMALKQSLALYIGGMGSRTTNFYNAYLRRAGFEEDCIRIQDLYLDGKKKEAIAAVPDKMVDTLYLVGDKTRIRDRLQVWKESPATTLLVGARQPEAIRLIAELNAE